MSTLVVQWLRLYVLNARGPGLIPGQRTKIPHIASPCGSDGKESAGNVGDMGLIPGLGRSPGEGNGYPFQYSDLENSIDCTVHGVAKNRT